MISVKTLLGYNHFNMKCSVHKRETRPGLTLFSGVNNRAVYLCRVTTSLCVCTVIKIKWPATTRLQSTVYIGLVFKRLLPRTYKIVPMSKYSTNYFETSAIKNWVTKYFWYSHNENCDSLVTRLYFVYFQFFFFNLW